MKTILFLLLLSGSLTGWCQTVKGVVRDEFREGIPGVLVRNQNNRQQQLTDADGNFHLPASVGDTLHFQYEGYFEQFTSLIDLSTVLEVKLVVLAKELEEANVIRKRLSGFDVGALPRIKGVQIASGTNAVIEVENMSGTKSTSNPREMFAKIPGLNIWESDGAGIQIGVGGRGLSPNRAANFNTRQNGYDISADALGYPESYYTPPFEALQSIEIIRGSASLQYGTQFGGLLNFNIREAPTGTPLEFTTRNTVGNYGYKGTFNRLTGTKNRFFYQVYHQYKEGEGYRENSDFHQHQVFAQLGYFLSDNWKFRLEYTHMNYLSQQAGGLTDLQFNTDPRQSFRDRNWFQVDWNMIACHLDYELFNKAHFNVRAFGMKSSRESLGFLGKISQADPGGNRDMIQGLFQNGGVEARYLQRYRIGKKQNENRPRAAFLVGGRYYQGHTQSNQGRASDASDADFRFLHPDQLENSAYEFPSQNASFFVENIVFLNSKWGVNAGMRYEFISSAATGFYKRYNLHPLNFDTLSVYTLNTSNSVQRKVPLFGGGATYKIATTSSAYLNCTQNYRAINFTDIRVTNPNIVIDSLMKDEYGYTAEVGFRGVKKSYFIYDLAMFYVFYGDKIGLAPKKGTIYKERTNIGNAVNYGLELFTELDIIEIINDSSKHHLNYFVNAAYIDAHYVTSKEANYQGKQVEYVSPVIVKTGLKWKYNGFVCQVQFSYNSPQFSDASNSVEPSGDAVIGEIPAYWVVDVSSRYQFKKHFQLELGVNNATNNSYYTRRATAYPGPGILPSDGIGIYFTAQYKFSL